MSESISQLSQTSFEQMESYVNSIGPKDGLLDTIAKVAVAILVLNPLLRPMTFVVSFLADKTIMILTHLTSCPREGDHVFGERRLATPFSLSSWFNSHTVMGDIISTDWDEERIRNGKLKQYEAMGVESWFLNTSDGSQIHGCYFDAIAFSQKIEAMGGRFVEFYVDESLFQGAEPIEVIDKWGTVPGVRISKKAATNREFLEFWEKIGNKIIPDPTKEGYYILLPSSIKKEDIQTIKLGEDYALQYDIFGKRFSEEENVQGIIFDKNLSKEDIEALQVLFLEKGAPYYFHQYKGKPVLSTTSSLPFAPLKVRSLEKQREELKDQVITLSQAQIASFFQNEYSKEIIVFLALGFNVFAYDHANKGLSKGLNTENGMVEATKTVGRFIKEQKGFAEENITFKGECSGALPLSEGLKHFHGATLWIDQAPRNYPEVGEKLSMELLGIGEKVASSLKFIYSYFLPSYDVLENLKEHGGRQIYTIGTPLKESKGDTFIPQHHLDAYKAYFSDPHLLSFRRRIEMPGADHLTHLWSTIHSTKQEVISTLLKEKKEEKES